MSEFSIFARGIVASEGFEEAVLNAEEEGINGYFRVENIAEIPEEPRVYITLKDLTGKTSGMLAFALYKDEAVELAKVLLMMFDYEVKK